MEAIKPNFPALAPKNQSRIITKHYTNMVMCLTHDRYCLLTWLIHQCGKNNVFEWDGHTLEMYRKSVEYAITEYFGVGPSITPQKVRSDLNWLKNNGLIFPGNMINPMLTYHPGYAGKKYKGFVEFYQNNTIQDCASYYLNLGNE